MALFIRHLALLTVGLLVSWQTPLRAQATSPAFKENRSFTVYAPVVSPAWNKLFYLAGPQEPVKLSFQNNRRSVPIKPAGAPKPLVFAVENIDPATQKKTYVPVAEASWPDGTSWRLRSVRVRLAMS